MGVVGKKLSGYEYGKGLFEQGKLTSFKTFFQHIETHCSQTSQNRKNLIISQLALTHNTVYIEPS